MANRFEKDAVTVQDEIKRLDWQSRNCAFDQINRINHYKEALSWLFSETDHLITMKGKPNV